MKAPKCKPWICSENNCRKCAVFPQDCPDDCQIQVLHALDRSDIGWFEKPRRSGKTYRILECASKLIGAGHDVVIITRNSGMREYIIEKGGKLGMKLFVSTLEAWKTDLAGSDVCFVMTDELSQAEVQDIQKYIETSMSQYHFLLGYYSEPIPEWATQP